MLNLRLVFLPLIVITALSQAEIFTPAKVTASSFVTITAREKHGPETIADTIVGDKDAYWASDFKSNAKPPHWLEFEFAEAVTFNEIKLDMVERYNVDSLINNFALEYWDGQQYQVILDKPKYVSEFRQAMVSTDWQLRYNTNLPTAHPVFRFPAITAQKVRVVIRDGMGRLDEMTVAFNPGGEQKLDLGQPFIKVAGNAVRQYSCTPVDVVLPEGVERINLSSSKGVYFCDRLGPDGFRRFFAVGKGENSIKIELPPGYYDVFALSGDFCAQGPGCVMKLQDRPWQYRKWELPGNPRGSFFWDTFTILVHDSGLAEIKLSDEWLLNGLLIAPVNERQAFQAAVDIIMHGNSADKFTYREPETNTVALPPTAQERDQGFIAFNPPKEQRIFPQTAPLAEQRVNQLNLAGAAGQRLALSLAFQALQDIPNFQLVVEAWQDSSGQTLSAVTAVHPIRVWPQRTDHKGAGKIWHHAPELLSENAPKYLLTGTTQQYYFLLDLPEKIAPGRYQSTVNVSGESIRSQKMPLTLEVYPFELADIDDFYFAMYDGDPNFDFMLKPENREGDLLRLRDMRRHNMNSVIFPHHNRWVSAEDFSEYYLRANALLDEAGFPLKPMPYHNQKLTADITRQVKDIVQKTGLREILFYPVDEPFNRKLDLAMQLYPEVKKVPGVRTYSTVTQNCVDSLGKSLDICCYTITGYAKFEPDRIRKEFAQTGQEFWWYTNASREYPDAVRYKAGFFFYRSGAKGQLYWAYDNFGRDPFSDFDASQADHAAVYIKGGKIVSTLQWEAIREGIDDFRYIRTLEKAIAAQPTHPACVEAKKLLQDIWQETIVDLAVYAERFGRDIEVHHKCLWEPELFDYYRQKISNAILAFQ